MINGSPRRHQAHAPRSRQRSSRKDDISGGKADIESITVIASAIKQLQILKHSSSRSVIGTRNCFLSVWCALELPRAPPGADCYPGLVTYWQLTWRSSCSLATQAPSPRAHGGCQAGGGCRLPRRFLRSRPRPSISGDRRPPILQSPHFPAPHPPADLASPEQPSPRGRRASEMLALLQRRGGRRPLHHPRALCWAPRKSGWTAPRCPRTLLPLSQ